MSPTDPPPAAPDGADQPTATEPPATPEPTPELAPAPDPAPATGTTPAPEAAPASAGPTSGNKDAAWLFVGAGLTFVTAGTVLAYSTSSSEQDLRDLYLTAGNAPEQYDAETKERYDDLVAEGERYERLAWTAFGLAAGCAIGATVFFVRASREADVSVTPVVSPTTTGASVSIRF